MPQSAGFKESRVFSSLFKNERGCCGEVGGRNLDQDIVNVLMGESRKVNNGIMAVFVKQCDLKTEGVFERKYLKLELGA